MFIEYFLHVDLKELNKDSRPLPFTISEADLNFTPSLVNYWKYITDLKMELTFLPYSFIQIFYWHWRIYPIPVLEQSLSVLS